MRQITICVKKNAHCCTIAVTREMARDKTPISQQFQGTQKNRVFTPQPKNKTQVDIPAF